MAAEPTNHTIDGDNAAARVRDVYDDCLQRRTAGEAIEDDVLIVSHPELMAELGYEQRQLRQIAAARSNPTQPLSIEAETISR